MAEKGRDGILVTPVSGTGQAFYSSPMSPHPLSLSHKGRGELEGTILYGERRIGGEEKGWLFIFVLFVFDKIFLVF